MTGAYERLTAAATKSEPTAADILEALAALSEVRRDIDALERGLIEAARTGGTSWAMIAAALGLASRQAAEQRWLRLSGEAGRDAQVERASKRRQRSVDNRHGPEIPALRAAVVAAYTAMTADAGWDAAHPLAKLARTTLGHAGTADPGALFALVGQALADLDRMPGGGVVGGELRRAYAAAQQSGR
jgi:hypothetical protein